MGGFRVGRKHASHIYPESRGVGGVGLLLARNYAQSPGPSPPIVISDTGTQIEWTFIEAGPPNTANVPITPQVTGLVRVIAMVSAESFGESQGDTFTVNIQANGATIGSAPIAQATVGPAFSSETVTLVADVQLPVGTTTHIQVLVTSSNPNTLEIPGGGASVDIQELATATG